MGNPFQGSSGSPPSNEQSARDLFNAYTTYLPSMQGITNTQTLPTAQNALNTEMGVQPIQNAFNLQQAQQYALPNAQIGQQVQASNTQAGSQTQLDTLTGTGGRLASAATALNRAQNPNYYNPQDAASRQATNLVNSINLNGLAPGEQNAVERSTNQGNTGTGNLGLVNPTNVVSNAMNFGGSFNSKLGILGNALGAATNTAQSGLNNGMNTLNTAFSQPSNSNLTVAPGQFGGSPTAPTGSPIGPSLLGANNSQITAQLPLQAQSNYQNSPQGSFVANSSMCCFIFMEIYNGQLPWYVRVERDKYYEKLPSVAEGYKKMAKWLVPKMQTSKIVRFLVDWTMVKPLTKRGAYTHHLNRYGILFEPVRMFWFYVWRKL